MHKKRIFKKTLAIELMKRGCNLVKVEPNKHNESLEVYSFEMNERLQISLDELMKS
ncbi:TPA: hypothetical protein QCX47_004189 [Bacillus mycoides]|nr:hypothetical protein [Bacillus mycoides]